MYLSGLGSGSNTQNLLVHRAKGLPETPPSHNVRDFRFHLLKIHHPVTTIATTTPDDTSRIRPGGFPVPVSDHRKPSITSAIGFKP